MFLIAGSDTFRVRGVTYGSFRSRLDGLSFPEHTQIKRDFVAIAEAGLNTVRTYSIPPPELLDIAAELGLRVIIGLHYHDWSFERHAGRKARRRILDAGKRAVEEATDLCAGNPAVLAMTVGNEVPVDLVRLHGVKSVVGVLSELVREVHQADPKMLATYVNFPTTEFLEIDEQDFVSFNVFLEQPRQLQRYLGHLQILAAEKPLLITELGFAGDVHGHQAQAASLEWQMRTVDEAGCAGATIFSWTDDWAVSNQPVEGWGFGLTTVDRDPKPALRVAEAWAASSTPRDLRNEWPSVSVVVCAFNEEDTIEECLSSLQGVDYPGFEVIVCDDGSTDDTLELAREFAFTVLELPHGGLSEARNAGLAAATGEIVAYLDADAKCHPDWLYYLALSLEDDEIVATGGPNLPFPDGDLVERAVALSPGSPAEVLLSFNRAEHVPGCNMAFRREALEAVGGFDPAFQAAGDDVDVCWKLLDRGEQIGFAPAAQVLHRRRSTVSSYLRQQRGYGRAERMLSGPHRQRFNRLGQARWKGYVYGGSRILPTLFRPVIYTGLMGMAPFQPVVSRRAEVIGAAAAALLPITLSLGVVGLTLGLLSRWWLIMPALVTMLALIYGTVVGMSAKVDPQETQPGLVRLLVGILHVLQPMARAWGRITSQPLEQAQQQNGGWTGDRAKWLHDLSVLLAANGCQVRAGPSGTLWDLRVTNGGLLAARITTAVAWKWEPRYRIRYRIRQIVWILIAAGFAFSRIGSSVGWIVLGGSGVWLAVGTVSLRRKISAAISATTLGSQV